MGTYTNGKASGTLNIATGEKGNAGKYLVTGSLAVEIFSDEVGADGKKISLGTSSGTIPRGGVIVTKGEAKAVLTSSDGKCTVTVTTSATAAPTASIKISYDDQHVWSDNVSDNLQLGGSFPIDGRAAEQG